jgi:hypothetical protein
VTGATNAPTLAPSVSPSVTGATNAPTLAPSVSPSVTGATMVPTLLPTPLSPLSSSLCLLNHHFNLRNIFTSGWDCDANDNPLSPFCSWPGLNCDTGDHLLELSLSSLGLSGTLPDVFGALTTVLKIDLSNNSLLSPLPASMSSLTQLNELSLRSNQFGSGISRRLADSSSASDPIFDQFVNFSALLSLDISDNGLIGEIPSSLCSLSLESLILASAGNNPNSFSCIADCLKGDPDLTLVVSSNIKVCIDTSAPSSTPTVDPNVRAKSKSSAQVLNAGSISGITIGVVVFVLLVLCLLYACLMRYRNHQAGIAKYNRQDENIIEKKSSFNLMSLSQIQEARSSSQGSGSESKGSAEEFDEGNSEESSIRNDEIDMEFFTPSGLGEGDVGVTIWNEELVDFHQGGIMIAGSIRQRDHLFTFADIYSSSEEDDFPIAVNIQSSDSDADESLGATHPEGFYSEDPRLASSSSSAKVLDRVNASHLQRHGSLSSMSSQSHNSAPATSIPMMLSRIQANKQRQPPLPSHHSPARSSSRDTDSLEQFQL